MLQFHILVYIFRTQSINIEKIAENRVHLQFDNLLKHQQQLQNANDYIFTVIPRFLELTRKC